MSRTFKRGGKHERIRRVATAVFLSLTVLSPSGGRECPAEGRTAEESLQAMKVAPGFEVELVAAEPLVRQPVAIEFDDRGRLWVIQYLQYPNPAGLNRVQVDRYSRTRYDRVPEPPPRGPRGADRITILHDADGDGRMDRGTDFVTGLNLATGMALGHGGVFVLNVPYLLFYPDRDRDDVPDSDPEVLLSGFGMEDAHSVANSLTWGPDGWLYGCQGSTVTANIRGIEFQQGVWRYDPLTRRFELFCEGGGNSWGLDFDRTGRLFYSTNYGGHVLLHGVQGGYFVKSFAKHGALHNPFAYGYLEHAPHPDFRGGHVTVGGIVYQGDSFPKEFRGTYLAGDLLGHRVNWHTVRPSGSTVGTKHGGVLLESADPWFAPTDVTMGPDGAIYVSDWCDARTAHPDPDAEWDRSNGRIFRIAAAGTVRAPAIDLVSRSADKLLKMLGHPSQWFVRKARQELARRCRMAEPGDRELASIRRRLLDAAATAEDETFSLENLWTLSAAGGFDEAAAERLLSHPAPAVRAWTVRLLGDGRTVSAFMARRLDELAEQEPAVEVRQQLACTARRLPAHQALPVINANIVRDLDNDDPYLPLLWWWAVEQHSVTGREEVLKRFVRPSIWKSRLGRDALAGRLVRRYAAETSPEGLQAVVALLKAAPGDDARALLWPAVLAGRNELSAEAWQARSSSASPAATELHTSVINAWQRDPSQQALTELAVLLDHPPAVQHVLEAGRDTTLDPQLRAAMLDILARVARAEFIEPAMELARSDESTAVRGAALRIVAKFDSPQVTAVLLELCRSGPFRDLQAPIVEILLARAASARALLAAVDDGRLSADAISFEQIRRVDLLNDKSLMRLVEKHWGRLKAATPEDKLAEVRRLNNDLRAAAGNADAGKRSFQKHCSACHTLFGEGKKLGPDLTTANRMDRHFLLVSLVDPDSMIRKEYVSVVVQTKDGRTLTGLPIHHDADYLALADGKTDAPLRIAAADLENIHESPKSLMPENLYRQISPQELRDLFSYLQADPPTTTQE